MLLFTMKYFNIKLVILLMVVAEILSHSHDEEEVNQLIHLCGYSLCQTHDDKLSAFKWNFHYYLIFYANLNAF